MSDDALEALIALDGAAFEMASGVLVEFAVSRVDVTPHRPHGISYALVLRPKDGAPWIRFDNAHSVDEQGGYQRKRVVYDHWHRTEKDKGRPYSFTSAQQLIEDFWKEVKRVLDEKGIPHDI
jgi:Family of unknown function (DUF6516)